MTTPATSIDEFHRRPNEMGWKQASLFALPVYIMSRAAVAVGAAVVAAELRVDGNLAAEKGLPNTDPHGLDIGRSALVPMLNVFTSWDGRWYMDVIRMGYPRSVPPEVTYFDEQARAAFFPAFPALAKAVDFILPGGDVSATLLLNLILGFVAVVVIGMMTNRIYGPTVARPTILLMAIFPGSFVFSFAYSEALMLCVAAGCLWALIDERWWLASLFGFVTTATRPNGVAVVVAAIVAAIMVWRSTGRRSWRPLLPVVISPLGFVLFQAILWGATGEPGVWFRVQREAWSEGASFGWTAIRNTFEAFAHPLTSPTDVVTAVSFVTTVAFVYFAWKVKLHPVLTAYSAVVVALMLLPATVTARPRFLFTAFPLLIAAAIWFDQRRDQPLVQQLWTVSLVACGAGLTGLTALYGVYAAIP